MTIITVSPALNGIAYNKGIFSVDEIKYICENKTEAIPMLLEYIQYA